MPLMNSPLPTLLLSAIYLFIVGMGKTWMEHRQPMRMDRIIIVYNVLQIVTNSIFVLLVGSFVGCVEMALFFYFSHIHRRHTTFSLEAQISISYVSQLIFLQMDWDSLWPMWVIAI